MEIKELPHRTPAELPQLEEVVEVVHYSIPLQAETGDTQADEDHVGAGQPPKPPPVSSQYHHNEANGQESQQKQQDKERHEEGYECWLHFGPSSGHHPGLGP